MANENHNQAVVGGSKDFIEERGEVIELLPAGTFKVRLEGGHIILAHLSGKMRMHYIKILPGDRVLMELSDDKRRGRIVRRL